MPVKCESADCKTRASFDLAGGKGRFCVAHKTAEMVDVKSKRCEHAGCDKITPKFDLAGGKGRFCVAHKTAEMVDVKSKRCDHAGCGKNTPSFDLAGGKGRFCVAHKTAEMVDVKSKQCEHPDCKTRASYGRPGHPKSHCYPPSQTWHDTASQCQMQSSKMPRVGNLGYKLDPVSLRNTQNHR